MSRRAGNISIKQLNAVATTETTTNDDGTTTTTISIPTTVAPVSTSNDVETVVTTMISNDKILDEEDVNYVWNAGEAIAKTIMLNAFGSGDKPEK